MSIENRAFKMHDDLMHTIIYKQAGTLDKSILELIMNSIDAGSTRIDIEINDEDREFILKDDGKGFTNENEINDYFDTLGTPHNENDAKFGRFRIGRTQIFAFGKTEWRSSTFKMIVDIKNQQGKLSYQFEKNLPFVEGCTIKTSLYDDIKEDEFYRASNYLSYKIKSIFDRDFIFSDVPVYIEDKCVVKFNKEIQWDIETEDVFIKFNNYRGVHFFNQGVFVKAVKGSYFGIGADVVSKRAFNVNFARNDILVHSCDLYKKVVKLIKEYVEANKLKKSKLSQDEKIYFFKEFIKGKIEYKKIRELKLFTDVFKKDFSLKEFVTNKYIAYSDGNSGKLAEMVHESKVALVFNKNFSELCEHNDFAKFINLIWEVLDYYKSIYHENTEHPSYNIFFEDYKKIDFQKLVNDINYFNDAFCDEHEILKSKDLDVKEKYILKAIRRLNDLLYKEYEKKIRSKKRKIVLGKSTASEAWTDGVSYIAINERLSRLFEGGSKSLYYILVLLIHEYCHDMFSTGEHPHDEEFYKKFHDILTNGAFKELGDSGFTNSLDLPRRAALTFFSSVNNEDNSLLKMPKKFEEEFLYIEKNDDIKNFESFIKNFTHLDTRKTFDSIILSKFLNERDFNDFVLFYNSSKALLIKELNRDSKIITLIYSKVNNIDNFIDFVLLNVAKNKLTTVPGIIKNIDFLIEEYIVDKKAYNISRKLEEECRLPLEFRRARNFLYDNNFRNFIEIKVLDTDIYDEVKKVYAKKFPSAFLNLDIPNDFRNAFEGLICSYEDEESEYYNDYRYYFTKRESILENFDEEVRIMNYETFNEYKKDKFFNILTKYKIIRIIEKDNDSRYS